MSDLFADFTQDAQQVLKTAQRVAKAHKQTAINPDHLLVGLLQSSGSNVYGILQYLRVNVDSLQTRLNATIVVDTQTDVDNLDNKEIGYSERGINLSVPVKRIIDEAIAEAVEHNNTVVEPATLLLGVLRDARNSAADILYQFGVSIPHVRQVSSDQSLPHSPIPIQEVQRSVKTSSGKAPIELSPIFIGLVIMMVVSGYLLYAGRGNLSIASFFFVISGWVVSVALHEFGHALVAYWGGDTSVVEKGYLTLDPLKYTHPLLSIGLPVLFLIMGGIGLPGGAVYIYPGAIRNAVMRSLTSAAGPIASAICGLIFALPLFFVWDNPELLANHIEFWAALGLLTFLEITAICLNLLPIPGLDGFGIIEPFLPPEFLERFNVIRPFSFFLLYGLLFMDTPIRDGFWSGVWQAASWVHPNLGDLVGIGFGLFRFWSG
ncbi:MAG: Clp protease N-terminal domain-containing protein [Chloroflexota bacterium]